MANRLAMWYYKILRVKCFNLFFVSLLWIIYEGNFTLMLTPLVVIRKTCRPTKYFPPPVRTDFAQWEQSMERRLRSRENWRDSHSHYYNWTDWEMVSEDVKCEKSNKPAADHRPASIDWPSDQLHWRTFRLFSLSSLSDFVYYCPGVEWPSLSLESLYTNRKCEDETFLQIVRFYCCCYPWLFCILFQLLARFAIWFALPLPLSETNILSPVRK